jgi:CDP-glycerol glycerophosphotransferase
MSVLSVSQAREKGYNESFVSDPALGDQVLLLYAARIRYGLTGKKSLLGVTAPELFADLDFCDIVENLSALTVAQMFSQLDAAAIKIFPLTYYQPKTTADGKFCAGFPTQHILAEICSRMGLSGRIALDPVFDLTGEEKSFGRFFTQSQVAVISQDKERRKTWGVENMQEVVDTLQGKFDFVQIGTPHDAPLKNVLDKRGAFPLRRAASVLYNSDLFVGGIGALMHLARGVNCPSVITYSLSKPLCADSYPCNANITATEGCSLCRTDMISPDRELEECPNNFSCVRNIDVADVCAAVEERMHVPPPLQYN